MRDVLALVRLPSFVVTMHVWCYGLRRHSGEIAGKFYVRLFFLVLEFFCVVETLLFGGEECLSGTCGLVGPNILFRILQVSWLRMGFGLGYEGRCSGCLIPAGVRSEWARLRRKGLATVWAPASQDTSHVGHAGVGVIGFRCAPVSLPTSAIAQIKRFFIVVVL